MSAKKILSLVAIPLVLVGMYLTFDWAIGILVHNRKVVVVPNLVGKNVPEALAITSALGLSIQKEGELFDKSAPPGTIVRQNPPQEMSVREGRTVRVFVSQGGEAFYVPNIIGQPLRNAQTILQNAGLNIGEMERKPSLRFERDGVISCDPPVESIISKGALINLVVSEGPPGADVQLVPDFIGRQINEARRWAASQQISVSVREENNLTRGSGEVLQQLPVADSLFKPGDTLTLVVSTGGMEGGSSGRRIVYEVPVGTSDTDIRVLMLDERGETEVFRKTQSPGSRVEVTVQPQGRARARIFRNGVMVEEQELQ